MKSFAMLSVVLLALFALVVPATAQTQGLEIQVTVLGHTGVVKGSPSDHVLSFSGPVGVPGVGLAPGAYIFRFVAPSVVQVLNEDRSRVYAMFFVAPTWRSEATKDYAVTLRRIRYDAPARIMTLFAPATLTGYEMLYPKIEHAAAASVL